MYTTTSVYSYVYSVSYKLFAAYAYVILCQTKTA